MHRPAPPRPLPGTPARLRGRNTLFRLSSDTCRSSQSLCTLLSSLSDPQRGPEPAGLGRREAGRPPPGRPPPLSPGSAFSGSRARPADLPAPFSRLKSPKCLAWAPASPAPARRRDRARAHAAPPAGPRGKDAPRARPGTRGGAPVSPLRSRGLPKMQIPGHTYQIAVLERAFLVSMLGGQGPQL